MPLPFVLGAALSALTGPAAVALGTVTGAAMLLNELKINESPAKSKELFTIEETMKILGMSKPTILKKIKEGQITPEELGVRGRGRRFHIRREEIESYALKNNIVPNWGKEDISTNGPTSKVRIEETIKLKELQKEEAELDLEELELEPDDTVDYKRKLIQAKKKVKNIDKDIQALKIILMSLDSDEQKKAKPPAE